MLSTGLDGLVAEDEAVFRTGLETARWISVDDTSARHAGKNGLVTQLGDRRFTLFRTAMSKSRRAVLSLLQPLCDAHRQALDLKRTLIWWYDGDLKA